jgi:ribose 5-phosphate isomerase B
LFVNAGKINEMTIYCASDHAGVKLRSVLVAHVQAIGCKVVDLGPPNGVSVDYPEFGAKLANAMQYDDNAYGIAVCGSGIGISIALNRFYWVRAALVYHPEAAGLARKHNNANVLAFGERLISEKVAMQCVNDFLSTRFEGGRHERRVEKLKKIGKNLG